MKDLVVLVADMDMEQTVKVLLSERSRALGLRNNVTFDIFSHPRHDPGVFQEAHEYLKPLHTRYSYALVMLDREGSGQERKTAREIEDEIQQRLDRAGWMGRSGVIVLDPELEVWVFSKSDHVIQVIADGDENLYQTVLESYETSSNGKPVRPKEAMKEILYRKRIPQSTGLYRELAKKVSLKGCNDRAFQRFRNILNQWFGRVM